MASVSPDDFDPGKQELGAAPKSQDLPKARPGLSPEHRDWITEKFPDYGAAKALGPAAVRKCANLIRQEFAQKWMPNASATERDAIFRVYNFIRAVIATISLFLRLSTLSSTILSEERLGK
jgi:hypothetical protein